MDKSLSIRQLKINWTWIVVLVSPIIGRFLLALISGSSFFHFDEWYTSWNDEVGYYRAILMMRKHGLPTGVYGYNEVMSIYPSYGPYNYITYLPYLFMSWFTGVESHNFIVYSNVAMIVLSLIVLLSLTKPSKKKSLILAAILVFNLPTMRYIWSGMIEASTISLVIIIVSIEIGSQKGNIKNNNRAIVLQTIVIAIAGIIRPFLFSFLLLPVNYYWTNYKEGKRIRAELYLILIALLSLAFYLWMRSTIVAKYFSSDTGRLSLAISDLKSFRIKSLLYRTATYNILAIKNLLNAFIQGRHVGITTAEFFVICIELAIISFNGKRNKSALFLLFVFIGIFFICVSFYSDAQLHRMLLACIVSGCIFIVLGNNENKVWGIVLLILLLCIMSWSIFKGQMINFYKFPQSTGKYSISLEDDFLKIFEQKKDKWDNTIASIPQSDSLYTKFALPSYIVSNGCRESYLQSSIAKGTLNSRYVWIPITNDNLIVVCIEQNYKKLWDDYGYIIFERM